MPKDAVGFDMGGGTGRWAQFVAPKVKTLNCVEPSDAINPAKKNLINNKNVTFQKEITKNFVFWPLKAPVKPFSYCFDRSK